MRPDKVAPSRVACVRTAKAYTVSKAIPLPLLPYSPIPTSSQIYGQGHKACATARNEAILLIKDHTATFVNMLSRYDEAFQYLRLGRPVTSCVEQILPCKPTRCIRGSSGTNVIILGSHASTIWQANQLDLTPDWAYRQPHYIYCRVLYESNSRGTRHCLLTMSLFPWSR